MRRDPTEWILWFAMAALAAGVALAGCGCSMVRYASEKVAFTRISLGTDLKAHEIVATFAFGGLESIRLGNLSSGQGDAAEAIVEGAAAGVVKGIGKTIKP
jgi:hypothetical protein